MEIIGPLLVSIFAGAATILGIIPIFIKIKPNNINKFIVFTLGFSSSVMISISIIELIPEGYFLIRDKVGDIYPILIGIGMFYLGYMTINTLNKKIKQNKSNLYRLGILNMIALMIHNFPEGIATFMSSYTNINLGINLGIAIAMHNIPEGIAISVPLFYSTGKKRGAITKTFISSLAEPLGALFAYIVLHRFLNNMILGMILIYVAGIMITLGINEIFSEANKYKLNKMLSFGLISGVVLSIINLLLF